MGIFLFFSNMRAPDFEHITALRELVSFYSLTDTRAEQQTLGWADHQFRRLGIDYIKIPRAGKAGEYAAVVGKVEGIKGADAAIISNGHVDVVPNGNGWTKAQGEMEGSIMYGRGTTDMKSAVISQIVAAKQARDSKGLPFDYYAMIVAGEEDTGWGSEQAVEASKSEWRRYRHLAANIAEPTSNVDGTTRVMHGNKGSFLIGIEAKGDTGHAATSAGKVNSIEVGADVIIALRSLRRRWEKKYKNSPLGLPVLTVTRNEGGVADNSLPPKDTVRYNGRFPAELKKAYPKDLDRVLKRFSGVELRIIYSINPAFTPESNPWVQANLQAFGQNKAEIAPWTTDGCFFSEYDDGKHLGIPLVIVGPGYLDQLHEVDEKCETNLIIPWANRFLEAGNVYINALKSAA